MERESESARPRRQSKGTTKTGITTISLPQVKQPTKPRRLIILWFQTSDSNIYWQYI